MERRVGEAQQFLVDGQVPVPTVGYFDALNAARSIEAQRIERYNRAQLRAPAIHPEEFEELMRKNDSIDYIARQQFVGALHRRGVLLASAVDAAQENGQSLAPFEEAIAVFATSIVLPWTSVGKIKNSIPISLTKVSPHEPIHRASSNPVVISLHSFPQQTTELEVTVPLRLLAEHMSIAQEQAISAVELFALLQTHGISSIQEEKQSFVQRSIMDLNVLYERRAGLQETDKSLETEIKKTELYLAQKIPNFKNKHIASRKIKSGISLNIRDV